jgi:FlgD Ig-like domain
VPSSRLVSVVFGVLVLATLGAFVVTQRLKRSTPFVERVYYYGPCIRPQGPPKDCSRSSFSPVSRWPAIKLRFELPKRQPGVTVAIVNDSGDEVRTLADDRTLRRGQHIYTWNGRDNVGTVVPDGDYRLRVTLRDQGRALTATRTIRVDTKPPVAKLRFVGPNTILPGSPGMGELALRFAGPSNPNPKIQVWRTDLPKPARVADLTGKRFRQSYKWQVPPLADGVYAVTVTVWDEAGNAGSTSTSLPPVRTGAAPNTGFSVRMLTVAGPLDPVRAGSVVRFRIGPVARRLRWNLTAVGAGSPVTRGEGNGKVLAVRVPSDAATGLYLLRVQAAGHRAVTPLVVRRHSQKGVLVVLPAITWQGLNQVDDDNNGFANLLSSGDPVSTVRPFAHGQLPTGLQEQVIPLLRFLAREHLPYELTTDLALAQGTGPGIGGRPGVLFAGDETWLTDKVDLALRDYVDKGGKVASFGTDAFRRLVSLGPKTLQDPTEPERVNLFGEETSELKTEPAPMAVNPGSELGLLSGTDGLFGTFDTFEQQDRLVSGTQVLESAGRDPKHPAFVAYKLGDGIVVRVGTPQWAAQLASDPELTNVTRHIWTFLSQ